MRLNHRQVEAFRAVMASGGMTAAAEVLHITQPAVSRLVRDLERAVGLGLFDRRGNQITPTAEALEFLAEVERSFLSLDHLARHAAELRDTRVGVLRLAALPAVATTFLPRFVASFCRDRPDVQVQLDGLPSHSVVEQVANGRYDFGVCSASWERSTLGFIDLEASAVVAMPDGHRLTGRESVVAADLADETLVMLGTESHLRHGVEMALSTVRFRRAYVTSMSTAACALVLSGAGVAIVDPFSARDFAGRGVAVRPFVPRIDVGYRLVQSRNRSLSRIASRFMADLRSHIAATGPGSRLTPGTEESAGHG